MLNPLTRPQVGTLVPAPTRMAIQGTDPAMLPKMNGDQTTSDPGYDVVSTSQPNRIMDASTPSNATSTRPPRTVREGDLLCRVGGDEFVPHASEQAKGVAARLREVTAEPFHVGAVEVRIGSSVGFVVADVDSTVQGLLTAANCEMYRDKYAGRVSRPA